MSKRWSRLSRTSTFRNGGITAWHCSTIAIIGCGLIGSRLAVEIVRSGADVWLCDPDLGALHNIGTQAVEPGVTKVDSVIAACDRIRPGAAHGQATDIRHVGPGVLRTCDVVLDCTDDPRLAFFLTEITNGLGVPLLRLAVDGSGQSEHGRVLCSDPRNGGACQMCSRSFEDLTKTTYRTPCPGNGVPDRPPTLAGGAIASSIVGLGLLQAQRLMTGNDSDLVRNREVIQDLSTMRLMSARLPRSDRCISGHQVWQLLFPAAELHTMGDLFTEASGRLATQDITIEPYNHPLCIEANCRCGVTSLALGTLWATAPRCNRCDAPMTWRSETQRMVLTRPIVDQLQARDRTLVEIGLPGDGAMFTARAENLSTIRIVLTKD